MPAPYYGDPEVIKGMSPALRSVVEEDFDAQLSLWDSLVRPRLEGDLLGIFAEWPPPDSTQRNAISTLWCYLVTMELQKSKYATNRVGGESTYGQDMERAYSSLLRDIKSGRILIRGARRLGSQPAHKPFTDRRLGMGRLGEKRPSGPIDQDTLFKRGIRK